MPLRDLLSRDPVFQAVRWPSFESAGIHMSVLREDLRHPVLGGNKLWKLHYNLERAVRERRTTVVSFGGAYSNHLTALSEACTLHDFQLHAFIRGEEAPMNERLRKMDAQGTRLRYLSRTDYRRRHDPEFVRELLRSHGITEDALVLPEGGNNGDGRKGCRELGALIPGSAAWAACAVGTGGTLAGMVSGLPHQTRALGITVVRSGDEPELLLEAEGIAIERYRLVKGYECGGYGKSTPELLRFCSTFSLTTGIPIEPVYTGKLFFALDAVANEGHFRRGEEVVVIHSGGIH